MKKCTIGLFSKIVAFLVFAVLFVPLTGIAFYFAFIYPQTQHKERPFGLCQLPYVLSGSGPDGKGGFPLFPQGRIPVPVGGNTREPGTGRAGGRRIHFLYPGKEEAEKNHFEPDFERI